LSFSSTLAAVTDALNELLGRARRPTPHQADRAGEIADVVRGILGLSDEDAVSVQQLECTERGCPPIETKIIVLGATSRRWTVHAPIADVSDATVAQLLAAQPEGENHDH
jgi:hypothetical protein